MLTSCVRLTDRVAHLRRATLAPPWPADDRRLGVVLVAHSMGYVCRCSCSPIGSRLTPPSGFVAADALFLALDGLCHPRQPHGPPLAPPIRGLLAFDTPFHGLAGPMFVYGTLAGYGKLQTALHVTSAVSAVSAATAGPAAATVGRLALAAAAAATSRPTRRRSRQLLRAGGLGAAAAAATAAACSAYAQRDALRAGVRRLRRRGLHDLRNARQHLRDGCRWLAGSSSRIRSQTRPRTQSATAPLAWLAAHARFVGALLRPAQRPERRQRLQRLARLRGVGVRNLYATLGPNSAWRGGRLVAERTFCAVPPAGVDGDTAAASLFEPVTMAAARDEARAHMSLFRPERNAGYEAMTGRAAELVAGWFAVADEEIVDEPAEAAGVDDDAAPDTARAATTPCLEHLSAMAQTVGSGLRRASMRSLPQAVAAWVPSAPLRIPGVSAPARRAS